eukprot:jgi/Tetstr1/448221/TSEL_035509.t1
MFSQSSSSVIDKSLVTIAKNLHKRLRKIPSTTVEYIQKAYPIPDGEVAYIGRLYPSNKRFVCFQNMLGCLRRVLIAGKYVEVDMQNAHFQLLAGKYPDALAIQDYISNREEHLRAVQEAAGVKRAVAKQLFIMLIFGGSVDGWKAENNIPETLQLPDICSELYYTVVALKANPGGAADLSSVEAAKFMRVVNNYGEYSISPNYDYLATVDPSAFANIIFGGNYSADTGEEDRSLRWPEVWCETLQSSYIGSEDKIRLGSLLGITASDFTDLKFVTGGVEVSGNIVPNNNQSHDLGSETHEWDHIFVKDVEVSDDVKVRNDVRFMVNGANVCRLKTHPDGCEVDGDMFPDGTETFSLGKIDKKWDKIYAKNTYSTTIDSAQSYAQDVYATVSATVNTLSVLAAADFGNNTLTGVASPTNSSDAMTKGYADANYLSLSGTINTNITVPAQSVIETNPTHPSANQLVTKKITEDRYSPKNHDHDGTYAELAVLNWISEFLSEMAAATTHGNLAASSDGTFATASFNIPNTIRFKISSALLAQNVQTVDSVRLTVRMFHSATGVYITSADQELSLSFDQATNTILASQTGSLSFGASTSLVGDLSLKIVIDPRIAGFRRPVMTAHAQGQWASPTVLRVDL